MRDERIDTIQKIINQNNNDVLQELFKVAQDKGVPTATIIRIWHGQLNWSRQPKLVDFLADALQIANHRNKIVEAGISNEPIDLPVYRQNKIAFTEDKSVPASIRKRSGALFKALEPVENEYDRDIAAMMKSEFIEVFDQLGYYNRQYISSALSTLNQYFKWSVCTGRPVSASWKSGELLVADDVNIVNGIKTSCFGGPAALLDAIEEKIPINEMHVAAPAAVLAWMGFSMEEALAIQTKEVDYANGTIRGRKIPNVLLRIIAEYLDIGDGYVYRKAGYGMRKMHVNDIGLFLKSITYKPTGKAITATSVMQGLFSIGLSYKDIQMSAKYFEVHQRSFDHKITKKDICEVFGIDESRDKASLGIVDDRLVEYYAYVEAFERH